MTLLADGSADHARAIAEADERLREAGHGLGMSLEAAAKHLGCSPRTLARWIDRGDVRASRPSPSSQRCRVIIQRVEVARLLVGAPLAERA